MATRAPDTTEEEGDGRADRRHDRAWALSASLTLVFESGRPCTVPPFSIGDAEGVTIGRGAKGRSVHRSETNGDTWLTIELDDRRMSLVHARLRPVGRGWLVEDAGSKNGTHVNGLELAQATLAPGDVLEVGRSFMVFRDDLAPPAHAGSPPLPQGFNTASPALARQFERLAAVARSSVSIVIHGETGTGKELVARAIHQLSQRKGPLRAVNCGALPRTLVESELFGYRKGAFSGASEDRPGLIRSADQGTLFLDEIGDLPLDAQAALLRVLQEGEVVPVGGVHPLPVDIRVVAATHRNLEQMVQREQFRADLLARLNGFTVSMPPLRDRPEDLGTLIACLIRRVYPERVSTLTISIAAIRRLFAHPWPGNIRELEKVISTAMILCKGETLDIDHLPESLGTSRREPGTAAADSEKTRVQRNRLEALLAEHHGNVAAVAAEMRTSRMQVHRLCRRLAIDLRPFRSRSPA